MTDFLFALIGAALISHFALGLPLAADALRPQRLQALGPCAALLILLAVPLAWLTEYLLQTATLSYLYLLAFILLSAGLARLLPTLLARWRPALVQPGLWPILLGNCLGAMLLARSMETFTSAVVFGLAGGLGFWLILQLFDNLQVRIERCDVPVAFRGTPILLISAGLMGLAFLGFNGVGAL
ncbi:MAG: Rnf-Nqr domain containing protein [Pseudomonas sp.]|uniref:Rnf-Nqr domain containing protein n=1 Tax=Pseudomonas sp. TaxID=306 RepID=UPI003D102CCE